MLFRSSIFLTDFLPVWSINYRDKDVEIPNCSYWFVYFFFYFYQFLSHVFRHSVGVIYFFRMLSWPSFGALVMNQSLPLLEKLSPHSQWTLFHQASGCHTLSHYMPILITPGPGTRQPGIAHLPQSLMKLFKLVIPKLACLSLPFPSIETWMTLDGVLCPSQV